MFSDTKTGMCRRPSCTAMVRPSMSGMIVEARDQVRMGVLLLLRRAASIFFASLGWTYGPYFTDLDMIHSKYALRNTYYF